MPGSFILRLVDVVLLLLLSLMAIASIRQADVEPPVSQTEEAERGRLHPLQIAVTQDGYFQWVGGPSGSEVQTITLRELHDVIRYLEPGRIVEFIADHRCPARLLIEANRAVQAAGREAVFIVELDPDKL